MTSSLVPVQLIKMHFTHKSSKSVCMLTQCNCVCVQLLTQARCWSAPPSQVLELTFYPWRGRPLFELRECAFVVGKVYHLPPWFVLHFFWFHTVWWGQNQLCCYIMFTFFKAISTATVCGTMRTNQSRCTFSPVLSWRAYLCTCTSPTPHAEPPSASSHLPSEPVLHQLRRRENCL